jgi:hypothetical protein
MRAVFASFAGLAALPFAVAAGPIGWDGAWAPPGQDCSDPVVYADASIVSNAADCTVTKVQRLQTASSWEVQLTCTEEARIYASSRIVLLNDVRDEMWIWFGPGGHGPVAFRRC